MASFNKIVNGYISASAITDIFYITNKTIKNKVEAKDLLKKLINYTIEVTSVDGSIISQALDTDWDDFEDCVQYYVALNKI